MERAFLTVLSLMACLWVAAQKVNVKPELFEGLWQVTMQSNAGIASKPAPPRTNDFKIYDRAGNFRHIIYANNQYVELSKGTIQLTSDSTDTEKLEKHLAVPASVKEGHIIFRFMDTDTFLMKWFVGNRSGEEVYRRVK